MPVLVDGVDLRTLGLRAGRWTGDLTPAVASPPGVAVPGLPGEQASGAPAVVAPRRLTISGHVRASTPAALRAAVHALVARCQGSARRTTSGPVALALLAAGENAAASVQWTAYLAGEATELERGVPAALARAATITLTFVALDPLGVDVTASTLALSTGTTRLPVGTAPSDLVIRLDGPIAAGQTRVVFLVRGDNLVTGVVSVQVPLSASVASGEWVEIDTAAETITHVSAGGATRTPRAAWLAAGDFFLLDPRDRIGATDPGLTLSAGTGQVTYRRAWR